jgi:endoglucanase
LRASARRVADDSKSDGLPGPDGDVRGISAAGAPLAIIAAIKDGGGAAGPSASVVSEVSCPTLGGGELPETLAVPGSTDGAVGAGVDGEDRSTGAAPTGPVVDTAVVGGGVASTTDAVGPESAAGAGASTTAGAAAGSATGGRACTTGAGSTTGVGACTTAGAGAGAGSTTGAGAGSTTDVGGGSTAGGA